MKKICLLIFVCLFSTCFTACKNEAVMLDCDGENCENSVEVEAMNDEIPDESWVVFCDNCARTTLKD